jgi:hypothetical protein
LDEIKGRIDLFCEQNDISRIGRNDIEIMLSFLSFTLLGIGEKNNNKYYRKFEPFLAKERIKKTISKLCDLIS